MDENKTKTTTLRVQSANCDISICKLCVICGEPIKLTETEFSLSKYGPVVPGVCDKCKEAVLEMRKNMEEKNNDKF